MTIRLNFLQILVRWVKLYDTLFIVLNEEGIVLSWKLCKGINYLSVENVLKLLKERLDRQGKNPTIFMLDNSAVPGVQT